MQVGFFALLMLCALAAPAFAAEAAVRAARWHVALALPAAIVSWALLSGSPAQLDIATLAVSIVLAAAIPLARPRFAGVVTPVATGAVSGVSLVLLRAQGAPLILALVLGLVPPATAAWLSRSQPRFAPATVRDEAFVVLIAIGLGVAMLPGVIEGWRMATRLNVSADDARALAVPVWALMASSAAVTLGGCYAAWRHR